LLFVRDLPPDLRAAYSSQSLRFIDRLVDLRQVATQVSWVVHHGNHSTMSTFMMAGVPQLVIPRQQEQLFCALRLVSAGCAAMAFQDQFTFAAAINAMQTNLQLKQCAVQVASRSHPYDLEAVMQFMGQTLDNLLCP
jgi:UDP:flavonoid glycosyltransferase YjiC (YdhE family)